MKKSLVLLLVVSLIMSIASVALASELTLREETQVWKWTENGLVALQMGSVEADARVWHQGNTLNGFCNKQTWTIDVASHASIAQWIKWELEAQGWNIKVRKPGTYIAGPIKGWVKSNADVLAEAQGFDDLKNNLGEAIETFYGITYSYDPNNPVLPTEWVKATQLPSSATIPFCYHEGYLWIKFVIREDPDDLYPKTRACEYQDDAQIFLSVTVLKDWIDPETGFFKQ
ncbi:hypothetical protein H5T89_07070 [bacterium]|nr:hypothetical protein [bacterium]